MALRKKECGVNGVFSAFLMLMLAIQLEKCYSQTDTAARGSGSSGPLILTPLLEAGRIWEAQEASRVRLQDFPDFVSYSGFFTVNKTFNSNLFFWFFPAADGNGSAPLLLWLQGGPGASSFYALFVENGPFSVGKDLRLEPREFSWSSRYSVVYIDNPVGTGYSFTDPGGYSTDESQVGDNLYSALVQFFQLFPQLRSNEFYVTGESYGGKYIPAVCYAIHERNPSAALQINLKGLAIGNAWIDPVSMLNYGDLLFQIGLVDASGRDVFKQEEREIVRCIEEERWLDAFDTWDILINGDQHDTTIFRNLTDFEFYYNFLSTEDYTAEQIGLIEQYLSSEAVRRMFHAESRNSTFQLINLEIERYLLNDMMQSIKPWFQVLVENYRVLLYNGQLDILVAYVLTEAFLDTLRWSGAGAYRAAGRNKWYVGEDLAGYSKTAEDFTLVLVRNAGHLVPADQPVWALDMISRFVDDRPF